MRRKHNLNLVFILFSILSVLFVTGCENIIFGGNIKDSVENDVQVTYKFYEFEDLKSEHNDVKYIIGRTAVAEDFPGFEHADTIIIGWRYFMNPETGRTIMPANFYTDERLNITSFRVTPQPAALYALWAKKCYITFVTNCETEIEPIVIGEGENLKSKVEKLTREDYNFAGWYTDEDFTAPYDLSMPVLGDMTLYAKWSPILHVGYHKNDGTQESDDYGNYNWTAYQKWRYAEGTNINIADCIFGERSGYGFVGWAKSPDATTPDYYTDDRIENFRENLELYAVWSTDLVKVTYNDPSNNYSAVTSTFGKGAHIRVGNVWSEEDNYYKTLEDIWLISQKEIKWWSKAVNVSEETEFNEDDEDLGFYNGRTITLNSDQTLYAVWGKKFYRVSFHYSDNGGYQQYAYQEVEYGTKLTKPLGEPYVPGCTFTGWYEKEWDNNGDEVYKDTPFSFNTILNDDTVGLSTRYLNLYAKFESGESIRKEFFVYNQNWWPYGNDNSGYGTLDKPWSTVSKAFEKIASQNNTGIDYTIYVRGEITDSLNITNLPAKSVTVKAMEDSWFNIKPNGYRNSYDRESDIPYVVDYELTVPITFENLKLYGKITDSQYITLSGSSENILPEINQGGTGFGLTFVDAEHTDVTVSRSQSGSQVSYTAGTGYTSYIWKVNGVTDTAKTGNNSVTFDTSSWKPGKYEILLLVQDSDGNVYSYFNQINKN